MREVNLNAASDWEDASAATLLAERDGLMPRMGIARASSAGLVCELRTEVRKGAGLDRTWRLVGRRTVRAFAWAWIWNARCVGDGEGDVRPEVVKELPSRRSGCSAKNESRERGPSEGVGARAGTLDTLFTGSTFADSVCTAGVSPAASGS